ncbi:hypothetical protein XAP412_240036 [Xanthomonas phaseoli pv. phaseoli]|uniref:Uncharacterized protein n=1 Tax=Xanthomonas campestris pv. phaseoli TaxID=317013 RepID=A0AB38DYP4_XANCH|nr:hypothetical protein XAP6984_310037 [Xanthomonas phaseoli pv. phaseoli]SON82075.1 hypothetical protein XAP412_240036 [Xanthomonas phaseoli pv. phaseoli]SON86354.1 hypothetical protein XAP7430_260035 [Xanthomonas phaseoli pv. phaseoli]
MQALEGRGQVARRQLAAMTGRLPGSLSARMPMGAGAPGASRRKRLHPSLNHHERYPRR